MYLSVDVGFPSCLTGRKLDVLLSLLRSNTGGGGSSGGVVVVVVVVVVLMPSTAQHGWGCFV